MPELTLPPGHPALEILPRIPDIDYLPEVRVLPRSDDYNSRNRLKVLLVNQMPSTAKTQTDVQWASLLRDARQWIDLHFAVPDGSNLEGDHIKHYQPWSALRGQKFDGVIITGAPFEHIPLQNVRTWPSLREILDWSRTETNGAIYVCWAASIALAHFHDITPKLAQEKLFGLYSQKVLKPLYREGQTLCRDYISAFQGIKVPISRFCYVDRKEVRQKAPSIGIALDSRPTHPGLLCENRGFYGNDLYWFNHLEYDPNTLGNEYRRDKATGKNTRPPRNYKIKPLSQDEERPDWKNLGCAVLRYWVRGLCSQRMSTGGPLVGYSPM